MMLTTQEQEAKLEELRESLTTYIETIAGVPVEILDDTPGLRIQEEEQRSHRGGILAQEGVINIFLPQIINAFNTIKENETAYFALGALNASKIRYGQGFEKKELRKIASELHNEGKKRFGKENPVGLITESTISFVAGATIGSSEEWSLTHQFKHSAILEQIIEDCERGRIIQRFYEEYPGAQEKIRTLFSKIYEQELEIATTSEDKNLVLDILVRRLGYILLTNDEDFYNDQESTDGKKSVIDKSARNYTKRLVILIEPLKERTATIHTSIRQAVKIYFELYDLMLKGELRSPSKEHNAQPQQLDLCSVATEEKGTIEEQLAKMKQKTKALEMVKLLDRVKETTEARNVREEQYTRKGSAEAFETRKQLSSQGVPTYHEWNEEQKRFMERYAHIQEVERLPPKSKKMYPYPQINQTQLAIHQERFEQLKPAEISITRRKSKGRLDPREHARHQARILIGGNAKQRFYTRREKTKRSVTGLLLLDTSHSTGKLINREHTILDKIKEAAHYMVLAARSCDDNLAVYGVTSEPEFFKKYFMAGPQQDRELERFYRTYTVGKEKIGERTTVFQKVQDFEEPLSDQELRDALTKLEPRSNNRDGAIIRHGTSIISQRPEKTKLLIYINDGAPEDKRLKEPTQEELQQAIKEPYKRKTIESKYEGRYAWADTIKAVEEATRMGAVPLIIRLGTSKDVPLDLLKQAGGHFRMAKQDLSDLVSVTAEAYIELGM